MYSLVLSIIILMKQEKVSKNQTFLYLAIGIIIGLLVAFLLSTPTQSYPNGFMGMMGFRSGQSSNIDRFFIEQMVPHHEDALTMANLALTKAKHQEIKTLAKNILTSQTEEISQMNQWYGEWYGEAVPSGSIQMGTHGMMGSGGMHMGLMGNNTDIVSLSSAPDFDKKFLEEMIPHHQMAVMMATMLESSTSRPEMRQLAKNIISAQNKEIADMRSWYRSWYY